MNNTLDMINFKEAVYFYKSDKAIVDYSSMQSFSLIKSCIEVFAYYGIKELKPADIKMFFEKINIVMKKNNKPFIPSQKKIEGVLDCCIGLSDCCLIKNGDSFFIEKWNTEGYKYEISYAYQKHYL